MNENGDAVRLSFLVTFLDVITSEVWQSPSVK